MKQQRAAYTTKTLNDVVQVAIEVFRWDKHKAYKWYVTPNPLYNNLSPFQYCKQGKTAKVFKDLLKSLI